MPQKISSGGFIEILVVLAGLTGLTAFGIIKTVPNIIASQPLVVQNQISPTLLPSSMPTPIATPSIVLDPFHAEETTGVDLTADLQLQVLINDEQKTFSLLGVEKLSTDSAHCIEKTDLAEVNQRITGKAVYLVQYDSNISDQSARYVFLENTALLNKELISRGLAKIHSTSHPYQDEFLNEQSKAQKNKVGIWSDACTISPTPVKKITTLPSVTVTPTRSPSPTKTPSPTQKVDSNIKGESTQNIPTITPTITLKEYISSSPSEKPAKSLNADLVFQLINLDRKAKNLVSFEKDAELCSLANSRVSEIDNEIFGSSTIHAGFRARNIPYWITENMAGYGSEQANVNWWLGSTIHRNAIEGDYKYSCGACTATSCVQLFTSYLLK